MHRKDRQNFDDIYENDVVRGKSGLNTTRIQSSELKGNDCVRTRSSRAALVCLVLLCFLLLTAVIVLSVYIYTNNIQERRRLLTNITNLTEERDEIICKNINLTKERDVLIQNNINLTSERDQLKNKSEILKKIQLDGWTYNQFSFYYMSSNKKKMDEGRKDCKDRGADLIIINNRQEQDFVFRMSGATPVWIGLTDKQVEGTWKWVDDSTLTAGYWASGEPNGYTSENCAVSADKAPEWNTLSGWMDNSCDRVFQWICEMSISRLI